MTPMTLKTVDEEERDYRRRYLLVLEAVSILINVVLALPDYLAGALELMTFDLISVVAMTGTFLGVRAVRSEGPRAGLHFVFICCFLLGTLDDRTVGIEEMGILFISAIAVFQAFEFRIALRMAAGHIGLVLVCVGLAKIHVTADWTGITATESFGTFVAMALVLVLITALSARQYQKVKRRVAAVGQRYNPVSGLPNRQVLVESMETRTDGFLVFLRCRNYFELNLVLGTRYAQTAVRALGDGLREFGDRLGADLFQVRDNEFALVFPLGPLPDRKALETALTEALSRWEHPVLPDGSEAALQVSVGAVELTPRTLKNAFSLADQALQTSEKHAAALSFYSEDDKSLETTRENLNRYAKLKQCLQNRSFQVYFQPVCDSRTLEPVFYEALLRVPEADGRMGSIFPYLPVAESSGLMPPVTKLVIREASRYTRSSGFPVSINLTIQDILDPSVTETLLAEAKDLKPGSFILEFLERSDFHEVPDFQKFLAETKGAGCLLALDDYGSGFSNLISLVDFPIDIVKIDGSLVKRCGEDPKALKVVKSLVEFSRDTPLRVVAEHIDSQELVTLFRDMGIHYLQGYHLGMPSPPSPVKP